MAPHHPWALPTTSSSEGASARAVVQGRSCTLHHPLLLGVFGMKIPGEPLEIPHCTGAAPFLSPSSTGHQGTWGQGKDLSKPPG